jgi:hypothetical protein
MGTTLTGTTPQDTYDSLIKVTDNGPLGPTTAKYLSDGLGNDSVLALSQAAVGIGTTNPLNPLFVSVSNAGDYAAFVENTNSSNGYGLVARTAHTGASAYAFAARADATDIFVVRADGHVGIGTGAPASTLDVSGTLEVSSTGVFVGDLRTNGNFSVGNTTLSGTKVAQIYPSATSTPAIIQGVHAGVGPYDLALQTSGGNVGIGTSQPAALLDVQAAGSAVGSIKLSSAVNTNGAAYLAQNEGGTSYFGRNSSTGGAFTGAAYATVVYGGGAYPMSFYTNDTERMRILSDGGLTFNGDTAQANALDDYEEGTFIATLAPSTSGTITIDPLTHSLAYTKIGRQVTVTGFLQVSAISSPVGGNVVLGGLPYVSQNSFGGRTTASVTFYDAPSYPASVLATALGQNSSTLDIVKDASTVGVNDEFYINLTYTV